MKKPQLHLVAPIFILTMSIVLLWFYVGLTSHGFLSFSDSAKFAGIARNITIGEGYKTSFNFFNKQLIDGSMELPAPAPSVSPVMTYLMAASLKLFGLSDLSIIIPSIVLFIATGLTMYFLGRKLFGNLVGFLSALVLITSLSLLNYATNGASEMLLIFEIIFALYLFSYKTKKTDIAGTVIIISMYFTRPQGFVFILGGLLYWLLLRANLKKTIIYFVSFIILFLLFDLVILTPLSGRYYFYSLTRRGFNATVQVKIATSPSQQLQGIVAVGAPFISILKKFFYNIYNFYKLLPQIASPYMWGLFIIGLFKWGKDVAANSLKLATLFVVIITFLLAALTIPFFRYLHPVVPLVYLFATATLVWIVREIVSSQWAMVKKWPIIGCFKKEALIAGISGFLVLFFVVGQTLGAIFLDSRFKASRTNRNKPPVYVELSWRLKEVTNSDDIIITNLDTWGSWYGERKTVWFPLSPDQLTPPVGKENPFDAIYLTNYLIDDENYYMGDEWRQIFYNPEDPENEFIAENYELKEIIEIDSKDVYEKQDARAVLLVKKSN